MGLKSPPAAINSTKALRQSEPESGLGLFTSGETGNSGRETRTMESPWEAVVAGTIRTGRAGHFRT